MTKQERHMQIKDIITHRAVGTQDELCRMLKKSGLSVTQATLSRDLRELGVIRANTAAGMRYMLHPESEERRMQAFLGYEIEQVDANESMIVVRTLPGRAQGVAEIIDSLHKPDILGTLAGDNTVFISPTSTKKIRHLLKEIRVLMKSQKQVA